MAKMRAHDGAGVYLKGIIFNVGVQLIAIIVMAFVSLIASSASVLNAVNWVFNALLQVAFLSAVLTTVIPKKRSLAIGFKKVGALTIIMTVIAGVACVFCFSYLAQWPGFLLDYIGFEASGVSLDGPLNIACAFLVAGVCAPIFEELVFRGSYFGSALKKRTPVVAILLSGVCFSLMHMNPAQTVYQMIVGVVASLFAYYSGSVISAITFHATSNLTVLFVSVLSTPSAESATISPSVPLLIVTVIMLILGSAIVFGATMAIRALNKKSGGKALRAELLEEEKADALLQADGKIKPAMLGEKSFTLYTLFALLISGLMWIVVLFSSMI